MTAQIHYKLDALYPEYKTVRREDNCGEDMTDQKRRIEDKLPTEPLKWDEESPIMAIAEKWASAQDAETLTFQRKYLADFATTILEQSSTAGAARQGGITSLEGLATYDPDRDVPGMMESRHQFNDGDWCKVEDVRNLLTTHAAPSAAAGEPVATAIAELQRARQELDRIQARAAGSTAHVDAANNYQHKVVKLVEASLAHPAAPVQPTTPKTVVHGVDEEAFRQALEHAVDAADPIQADWLRRFVATYLSMSESSSLATRYSDMLREICFQYSAGGYNSEGLMSPESAADKIRWIIDDTRRAALAAPVQPAAVPAGYVLMPERLTAENGAKGALSGEFKESVQVTCPECDGSGDDPDFDGDPTEHGGACLECNGEGTVAQNVPVSWDTIKDIYKAAVELLAAAPSPAAVDGAKAIAADRDAVLEEAARICDEMEQHYSDYKDTALLNGDVDLSNAASGEPRACRFIAERIRALKSTSSAASQTKGGE